MNAARTPAARRQRGAALLTAMIIVTLVVTMASAMVWQQWRAVQVEIGERARSQAAWILNGALDWAKLILRENQRSNASVDHLGQPWAVPLAESRLSTFLAADKDATADDGPEAFLSGAITDAQSRLNLRNLVRDGRVDRLEYAALARLCDSLGLDAKVAGVIAGGLLSATIADLPPAAKVDTTNGGDGTNGGTGTGTGGTGTGGNGGNPSDPPTVTLPERSGPPPLLPRSVSQLAWLGLDAQTVEALRPFVALLPLQTSTNVNTAPREVLAAAFAIDLGSAERLVQIRQRTPFKSAADFTGQLRPGTAANPTPTLQPAVGSNFFEVRGRLRLNDRVLETRSLLQRQPNGQILVIETERTSGYDEPPRS